MFSDIRSMVKRQFSTDITQPQLVFDVMMGVVLPAICLILDPIVFREHGGFHAWQSFAYTGIAIAAATLLVWLFVGRRLPRSMRQVVASILLVAAIVAGMIGIALLPISLVGLLVFPLSILGLTPLLTAFVYLRNAIRCFKAAGWDPLWTWPLLIILGIVIALGVPLTVQLSTPAAFSGVMADAEATEPVPPKPETVYLDIAYHGIGWSPDRSRYYFVKVLNEQRDQNWGWHDSPPSSWAPVTTRTRHVLSSVARDGSAWQEHFEFPVGDRLANPDESAVDHAGRLIVGLGREVRRFSPGTDDLIGEAPFDIDELAPSPSGESLAVGNGGVKGGIALMSTTDGRSRVITSGYDMDPHWSPDGRRIAFGRFLPRNEDRSERAIVVYDLDSSREEVVLQGRCTWGDPSGEWADDRTIAVSSNLRACMPPQSSHIQVETADPPPDLGPSYEKSRCMDRSRGVWTAEQPWDRHGSLYVTPGADGYAAGYRASSVQVLRVGNGSDSDDAEPPCEVLFNAFGHRITITNNTAWEHELDELRDGHGAIW